MPKMSRPTVYGSPFRNRKPHPVSLSTFITAPIRIVTIRKVMCHCSLLRFGVSGTWWCPLWQSHFRRPLPMNGHTSKQYRSLQSLNSPSSVMLRYACRSSIAMCRHWCVRCARSTWFTGSQCGPFSEPDDDDDEAAPPPSAAAKTSQANQAAAARPSAVAARCWSSRARPR